MSEKKELKEEDISKVSGGSRIDGPTEKKELKEEDEPIIKEPVEDNCPEVKVGPEIGARKWPL